MGVYIFRKLNIIRRAVQDFGMVIDEKDEFTDVVNKSLDVINNAVDYDYIDGSAEIPDRTVIWIDKKGWCFYFSSEIFEYRSRLIWWRYDELKQTYFEINPADANEAEDFVQCCTAIDSDARKVLILCKYSNIGVK